jgi:hypothetical protein
MSVPRLKAQPTQLEIEVAQLRAQVRAMGQLLVECGVVDASMLQGRLAGAASRVAAQSGAPLLRSAVEEEERGFWSRLFGKKELVDPNEVGPIPTTHLKADQTEPVVQLPFRPKLLYAEPDLNTDKRRNLTPTEVGKCERCWRMRPLAANKLCSRCG